jgi:hypothetical protein
MRHLVVLVLDDVAVPDELAGPVELSAHPRLFTLLGTVSIDDETG